MPTHPNLVFLSSVFLALTACSEAETTKPTAPETAKADAPPAGPASAPAQQVELKLTQLAPLASPTTLPKEADTALRAVVRGYLELKTALVASDAAAARRAASSTVPLVDGVPVAALSGAAAAAWKQQAAIMRPALTEIVKPDADLAGQRLQFARLSEATYAAARSFALTGSFVQHCPMANDNTGAIWLSAEEPIKNPYFGDSMLRCGEVKERI